MSEFPIPDFQDQKSSLKLIKNTKGYGWEIKVYDEDIEKIKQKTEDLEKWAKENYGKDE